jgi:serine/threonine protein kinase
MTIGGFSKDAQELWDFVRCMRPDGSVYGTSGRCRKGTETDSVDYEKWSPLAEGNYGKVSINPEGTRVVKTLHIGKDGKKGEFGPHEIEIATKMGELGHSPKIHSHSKNHIEMDVAPGKTLWEGYSRKEGEPQMNTAQATKAAAAIRDLHKMGFAHGDLHSLQFLIDGDNAKLVDFGLSVPTSMRASSMWGVHGPTKVMQDLSKIGSLINWKNPKLQSDPYIKLVNKYLDQYKAVQGNSQAAKAKRNQLGEQYLQELNKL